MKDHLDRNVILNKKPERIVSLVPSLTELVADLGMKYQLVGVTKFCVHPADIKKRAQVVGGTKTNHINKIKALQPDLILCNKEENTAQMVAELELIAPVHVCDIVTFSDVFHLLLSYGELLHKANEAETLLKQIQQQIAQLKTYPKQKTKVGYFIWKDPWMVAANNTFINSVLNELGFINAFEHLERYPEVDINNLPDLDWIFLSSEPYPFKKEQFSCFSNKKIKLEIVDGEAFSWYGSRLLKSFNYFNTLLKRIHS